MRQRGRRNAVSGGSRVGRFSEGTRGARFAAVRLVIVRVVVVAVVLMVVAVRVPVAVPMGVGMQSDRAAGSVGVGVVGMSMETRTDHQSRQVACQPEQGGNAGIVSREGTHDAQTTETRCNDRHGDSAAEWLRESLSRVPGSAKAVTPLLQLFCSKQQTAGAAGQFHANFIGGLLLAGQRQFRRKKRFVVGGSLFRCGRQ